MNFEPDKTKGTLDAGETHINSNDAEGVSSGHSFEESTLAHSSKMSSSHFSEGESSAHLHDEDTSNNKRKLSGEEEGESSDKKDDLPIPEKKFRISVRKFSPEELNPPETSEVGNTDSSHLVLPTEGANNIPSLYQYLDDYFQPCSSGLVPDLEANFSDPTLPLRFDKNEMDTVLAFINLILVKRDAYNTSPDKITSLIDDLIRIIKTNQDTLYLTDELRRKINLFCINMTLLCNLSVRHLGPSQEISPFLLEYAKIAHYCYQDEKISSCKDKLKAKQQILLSVNSCKEHLDDLKRSVDESIRRESLRRSLALKGKQINEKDGTSNVLIDLDDISDDEEVPIILPDGVSMYMNDIENVLSLDVIPKLLDTLSPRGDPKTEELLSSNINETLIYKASAEISCLNVSENLLVVGHVTGKVVFINLLNNEVIEEKTQDYCNVITFVDIWENNILTTCDQYVRCLSLAKNFSKVVALNDLVTAMSIYGGSLHIGTRTGIYYKLSLPHFSFDGKSPRVCDYPIISLNVVKGTQSSLILFGTSSSLFLWDRNQGTVMTRIGIPNPRMLYITPEFILTVSDGNIKKASTSEIQSMNLIFKDNPWQEGSCGCILNGEERDVLIGCKNGDFAHFSQNLLFLGRINGYEEEAIKFLVPWRDKMAMASNGKSIFYVSTVNPMIKKEPLDIEEQEFMDP